MVGCGEEDYVKAIYVLSRSMGRVTVGALAGFLDVKPPSVSEMVTKLVGEGVVSHRPYGTVELTGRGEQLARSLLKRYHTIYRFLRAIGVPENAAERDSCRIEHYLSPVTVWRMEEFVNSRSYMVSDGTTEDEAADGKH